MNETDDIPNPTAETVAALHRISEANELVARAEALLEAAAQLLKESDEKLLRIVGSPTNMH
jgi:hypothetical protein